MANTDAKKDLLNFPEEKKLPDMLNVLTILTFIWSGISVLLAIYGFANARASYEQMVKMQDKLDQIPSFMKSFMGPDPVGMSLKMLDNRVPVTLLSLVSTGLCWYGALQMRRLKKMGFSLYILGDIVPFISSYIFLGATALGGFGFMFGIAIMAIFIILYATQLKYMS
jgi:hypothetical protein